MGKDTELRVFGDLDAVEVINLFVDSLADPHHPKHCAKVIYACIICLHHGPESLPNCEILCRAHHNLYDTCANFITAPRTDEEIAMMRETIVDCHCDLSDKTMRELHRVAGVSRSKPCDLTAICDAITAAIHNALQPAKAAGNLHKVAKNAAKAAISGKASLPWPTSPQDIIPNGPETSIASIGKWVEVSPMPLTLGFLGSILEICKRDVIPYFVSSPTLPGKFVGITEIIYMLWAVLDHTGGRVPGMRPMAQTPAGCLLDLKRAALIANQLTLLCTTQELAEFAQNAEVQHRPVLGLCKVILEWLPKLDASIQPRSSYVQLGQPADTVEHAINHCRTMFLTLGSSVHRALELPYDVSEYGPLIVFASRNQPTESDKPIIAVVKTFHEFYHHHCCFNPSCTATYESAARKFPMCSACRRVPYCSKKCQTEAWTNPAAPHKNVCKKIKKWAEDTGIPKSPEQLDLMAYAVKVKKTSTVLDEGIAIEIVLYGQNIQSERARARAEGAAVEEESKRAPRKAITMPETAFSSMVRELTV